MDDAPAHLLADPVIADAMRRHGVNPDTVIWGVDDGRPVIRLNGPGLPGVRVDANYSYVRWWRAGQVQPTTYVVDGDGSKLRVGMDMTDSMLASLPGRPLASLVCLPGDPGMTIAEAHVEHLGEFRHLVAKLRNAA